MPSAHGHANRCRDNKRGRTTVTCDPRRPVRGLSRHRDQAISSLCLIFQPVYLLPLRGRQSTRFSVSPPPAQGRSPNKETMRSFLRGGRFPSRVMSQRMNGAWILRREVRTPTVTSNEPRREKKMTPASLSFVRWVRCSARVFVVRDVHETNVFVGGRCRAFAAVTWISLLQRIRYI